MKNTFDFIPDDGRIVIKLYSKSSVVVVEVRHEMLSYWSEEFQKQAEDLELLAEQTQEVIKTAIEEKVQSDWNEQNTELKSFIKNKPYIPAKVSDLTNDSAFITIADVPTYSAGEGINITNNVISNTRDAVVWGNLQGDIEDQEDLLEYVKTHGGTHLPLFTPVIQDRVLSFEESRGLALQGTYVHKTALAGARYGYPTFYNKCIEEKNAGSATRVTLGDNTITMYVNSNGHRFYNIADKSAIDAWFETYGIADFYGVDTENERIFMPRNKYFMQLCVDTADVNKMNKAGVPNLTGQLNGVLVHPNAMSKSGVFQNTTTPAATKRATDNGGNSYWNDVNGIYFDASDSNSIYGNSNTVQPPSSNKLLYYVVGNIEQDTSWINVVEQVENGVQDIDDELNLALAQLLTKKTDAINEVGLTGTAGKVSIFQKGNIQDNDDVYANVYDLNHSTFDLSKFTVVGSPNVASNGVASGFTSSNYLKTPAIIDKTKPFTINFELSNKTASTIQVPIQILGSETSGGWFELYIKANNMIEAYDGTNYVFSGAKYTDGCVVSIISDGTNLHLEVDNKKGTAVAISSLTQWSSSVLQYIKIGVGTYFNAFTGSIDLKNFSITVDGKPVFSGNKTGIDTIKPNSYTVVGNPTITADGMISDMVSSMSENAYVYTTLPSNLSAVSSWQISMDYTCTSLSENQRLFGLSNNTLLQVQATTGNIVIYATGSSTGDIINNVIISSNPVTIGSTRHYDYIFTGTEYIIKENGITIYTKSSTTKVGANNVVRCFVGQNYAPCLGAQDLNSFKVYINGKLVYQPCLKIPYKESKTGLKVVDVAYRNRVQDVYEQYGTAMYYTIDEENENYTLPVGEVYGMIEQKVSKEECKSYVIETYQNGNSWYRVYSDGWCEQGGLSGTIPATGTATVQFLKAYADTNYSIMLSNSSYNTAMPAGVDTKYTDSMTIDYQSANISGVVYWETKGYLAEGG